MSRTTVSVNELALQLAIPAGTLRRYLRQHAHLLDVTKVHKSYVVAEESVGILKQIREEYARGLSSEEVEARLLGTEAQMVAAAAEPMPAPQESAGVLEALANLEQLVLQRFEQQDQLLKALAEIAPALQHQLYPENLRAERVDLRMKEWRIERKLQAEALEKWAELPKDERMVRTSLFSSEENTEKRDRFVRDYVDKHFDDEMRRAYGL
ncbi:hypothetical protein E5161_11570 [Cohnella pontilimi]|uniref:Uncharacterized protein n=1 Tax=Cohnella pontilimi TaxID=2564100 RepID=A0A4U0FC98_9BACL|nr:hypothetical protein [Cohnella pontilimi]TJY41834.1 hypothetical protein E5161_11570 [Cohnella pontilimi]